MRRLCNLFCLHLGLFCQQNCRYSILIGLGLFSGLFFAIHQTSIAAPSHQEGSPVVLAAGDISNCNNEEAYLTAWLIETMEGTVLPLGDNAYESGTLQEYHACYAPTWGRHITRTRPVPGNHDYGTQGAEGYFTYFGDIATPLEPGCRRDCGGYYSYNLGEWHVVALNSEIDTRAGSPQEQWLRADLAANPSTCTLAYWHRPRFSSRRWNKVTAHDLWKALYDYGAEVVLVGHDHHYERFAPMDRTGQLDHARGIREFVVGTGGAPTRDIRAIQPNSEVRNTETFGIMKLTLHPTSYEWEFIPIPGQTFTDKGSAPCFAVDNPPPPPAGVTAVAPPSQPETNSVTESVQTQPAIPVSSDDYTIQAGDTLSGIALRYGLDWRAIASANNFTEATVLRIGQVIQLPGTQGVTATADANVVTTDPVVENAQPAPATLNAPQPTTSSVSPTAPTTAAPTATETTEGSRYVVQAGDTLFTIAVGYNLNWQTLATANNLGENDILRIGQTLVIPGQTNTTVTTPAPAPATVPAAAPIASTEVSTPTLSVQNPAPSSETARTHTVVSGDTMFTIAVAYGLDWKVLLSLNGLTDNSLLQIGQEIRLE